MKLSTKCRYGVRALVDLAIYSRLGHVALHEIAKRQNISLKYLEQDFSVLRRAGIVKSVKGAQGGYYLAVPPETILLGTIVLILEGDLQMAEIEDREATPIRGFLAAQVWDRLNQKVQDTLMHISLADVISGYEQAQYGENMYFI